MLFFSSLGRVYKEKVWRLPLAAPQARGKPLINILPIEQGELMTSILPLPEDESTWGNLDVMFATTKGTVRRNKLSDFVDVRRSGIIAMKLAEGEGIVDVQVCTEKDDVLLTTAQGQCIRFAVTDVRVFQGRTSMGVRGIKLAEGDRVISQSILRHLDVSAEERMAYLKRANAVRRGQNGEELEEAAADAEEAQETAASTIELGEQRYVEMSAAEQFILTVSERGYGKRSSSYEYRITNRGGKGIVAMAIWEGKKGAETIKDKIGRAGRLVPGRGGRPDHAGHRRRATDPLPGERHPHRRPLDAGRDRVQHRRRREGGLGRAHRRRGRGRERRLRVEL